MANLIHGFGKNQVKKVKEFHGHEVGEETLMLHTQTGINRCARLIVPPVAGRACSHQMLGVTHQSADWAAADSPSYIQLSMPPARVRTRLKPRMARIRFPK